MIRLLEEFFMVLNQNQVLLIFNLLFLRNPPLN